MRNIFIGLAVVVVLFAGGAFFVLSNLDSLVQTAIEEGGSRATGTDVAVGGVTVSLGDATASITEFSVANPDGFKTDNIISFDEVTVALDTAKTNDKLIYITLARIIGPTVAYEGSGPRGQSNVDEIMANVERLAKQAEAVTGSGSETQTASEEPGPEVVIEKLVIEETTVLASVAGLDPFELALGGMELENIGTSGNGAGPEEVMNVYMSRIGPAVIGAVGKKSTELLGAIGKGATDAVQGITEGLGDATSGAAEGAGQVLEGVGGAAGEAAEGATKAIQGLFGN